MQTIGIEAFTYTKAVKTLSTEASDLRGKLDLNPLINALEHFEVVGRRETKRYMFWTIQREGARHEIGDIQSWEFRPVDRYGRGIEGPKLTIFND